MSTATVRLVVAASAKQAMAEIDKLKKKLFSLKSTKGWSDLLTGAAIGAGIGAFNAVGNSIRGLGAEMADAVVSAADFERAMLNVNSIAKQTPASFAAMSKAVLDLTSELPQTATDLASGLYDIASSGFAGADGVKVLQASAKAASAGLATTADSARAVTAVLNAYGLAADQAGSVSDVLFQIVNRGVITFPELSAEIGKTTALAAPLGVSLTEVGAALSVLTKAGIDAENATTQVNAVLSAILQPSAEAQKLASSLGLEWNATALRAKGLSGVLADMIARTNGSQERMAALLGDARAIRGAFVLAADGGSRFRDELGYMQQSAGATDDALSYQKQGLAYQFGMLSNSVERLKIELGSGLLPIIKPVIAGLLALANSKLLVPGLLAVAAAIGVIALQLGYAAIASTIASGGVNLLAAAAVAGAVGLGTLGIALAGSAQASSGASKSAEQLSGMMYGVANAHKASSDAVSRSIATYRAGEREALGLGDAHRATAAEIANSLQAYRAGERGTLALADAQERTAGSSGRLVAAVRAVPTAVADMARGVLSGTAAVQGAWDTLVKSLEDQMSAPARMAWLYGKLTSKQLADGMTAGDPYVRQAAKSASDIWTAELDAMTQGAYSAGLAIINTIALAEEARHGVGGQVSAMSDEAIARMKQRFAGVLAEYNRAMATIRRTPVPRDTYTAPETTTGGGTAKATEETKTLAATVKDAMASLRGMGAQVRDLAATFSSSWTPAVLTSSQAATALQGALGRVQGAIGGMKAGIESTRAAVASAFSTMLASAKGYFEAVHRERLADLSRSNDAIQRGLQSQIDALNAGVAAQRDALQKVRDARRESDLREALANAMGQYSDPRAAELAAAKASADERARIDEEARLRAAVTSARTRTDRRNAQAALDEYLANEQARRLEAEFSASKAIQSAQQDLTDFLADQDLARLENTASAQVSELQARQDAQRAIYDSQVESENARYEAQQSALEKLSTGLADGLDKLKGVWTTKNKEILALLGGFGAQYAQVGASLMAAFSGAFGAANATVSVGNVTSPGVLDQSDVDALNRYIANLTKKKADNGGTLSSDDQAKLDSYTARRDSYSARLAGSRATGGPVLANRAYVVGEQGPEVLVMGPSAGRVASNSEAFPRRDERPVQINLVVDGKALARIVDERLFYSFRTAARTGSAV